MKELVISPTGTLHTGTVYRLEHRYTAYWYSVQTRAYVTVNPRAHHDVDGGDYIQCTIIYFLEHSAS